MGFPWRIPLFILIMARTLKDIKLSITNSFIENESIIELYQLTPGNSFEQEFSKVSVEWILFDLITYAIWSLEVLFDIFKNEMETEISKNKIHSKDWYRQKALDYQYGFSIIPGTDKFDNTGASDDEISASKIVAQAACIKMISSTGYGILRVKVAKDDGSGNLAKLSNPEHEAIRYYFLRYATDAGTQLRVTTGDPDDLKLRLDVYYDPLVLSTTGTRLDGSSETPVIDGVNSFLKSLEFNGALVISDLSAYLRTIEGIKLAKIKSASSKYGNYTYTTTDIINVGLIDEIRVADSGYMQLDLDEFEINYIVMPD